MNIPDNFPFECSDRELEEIFNQCLSNHSFIHSKNLTNLEYERLLKVTTNEIQRRAIENLEFSIKENIVVLKTLNSNLLIGQKKSSKLSIRTAWLSVVTIILAALTIYFAFVDNISDKNWMTNEKKLLNEMNNSLYEIKKVISTKIETYDTVNNEGRNSGYKDLVE